MPSVLLPSHTRQNGNPALDQDENGTDGSHPLTHSMADQANLGNDDSSGTSAIPPHPLGVKPLGNKYFSSGKDARKSLGTLQVLPDEMLMQLLEFLDVRTLRRLGYSCRFLFACCMSDDVWKTLFLE